MGRKCIYVISGLMEERGLEFQFLSVLVGGMWWSGHNSCYSHWLCWVLTGAGSRGRQHVYGPLELPHKWPGMAVVWAVPSGIGCELSGGGHILGVKQTLREIRPGGSCHPAQQLEQRPLLWRRSRGAFLSPPYLATLWTGASSTVSGLLFPGVCSAQVSPQEPLTFLQSPHLGIGALVTGCWQGRKELRGNKSQSCSQ